MDHLKRSHEWLKNHAIPLWLENGIDWTKGGFFEELSFEGAAVEGNKRALVQARQIYSFRVAKNLNLLPTDRAVKIIRHGAEFLMSRCSLPSGGFLHSVDSDGKPVNPVPELYTQAFGIFGLANAFAEEPDSQQRTQFRDRARAVVNFLKRDRRVAAGGFNEIRNSAFTYESNPHMHLFEAALSWMEVDQDPIWRTLADEVLHLCLTRFIVDDHLCEHFDENWQPITSNNRFVFEPGHHYEWAWLMGRYEKLTGKNLLPIRNKLFESHAKECVSTVEKLAFDEMWSDNTPKTKSSRFWPQCERIKAASQFKNKQVAQEAMEALFLFFETDKPGLWMDRRLESGKFTDQLPKASSLYHIIGAISEGLTL
jgi:mannose/cellobiose epimerase-like protein (N-acyl-D-glucosamine 2-epimerase family)